MGVAARVVEIGRVEVKGAAARLKQKGTLEAHDVNLADLRRVYVRVTPSPELRLFADLVFTHERVFRFWQDVTLVNYRDFLEKVELTGVDNFRALVRHATKVSPEKLLDAASREFAFDGRNAERFVSREEMGEYESAILAGASPAPRPTPAAAGAPATVPAAAGPAVEMSEAERKIATETAWVRFTAQVAAERAERAREPKFAALAVTGMGMLILAMSMVAFLREQFIHAHGISTKQINGLPLIAIGAIAGLVMVGAGLLFLRRAQLAGD